MKKFCHFVFVVLLIISVSKMTDAQFSWPNNAKAAVVFTYDDGLDCHLDVAVPQLDEFGFKGTFYCPGNSQSLYNRTDDWRKIARNGHEFGNHTLFHPCDASKADWVKPEYDLNNYTIEQLLEELKTANTLLKAIDGKKNRTFAYTCSNVAIGENDFSDDIQPLFTAARADGSIPETMNGYNIYKAPSWMVEDHKTEDLIACVEEAKAKGTIAVFMFHSVGGGYLNVGAKEHRELLQYLNEHRDEFYIGTFAEVMGYIQESL
ncbi:MAG: polysaccharide deacetylase family protein [Mariniphaga sp.]